MDIGRKLDIRYRFLMIVARTLTLPLVSKENTRKIKVKMHHDLQSSFLTIISHTRYIFIYFFFFIYYKNFSVYLNNKSW